MMTADVQLGEEQLSGWF